ncbi:MAG: tetratricopeptide repeat protein [Hyphomonadaceae bacterium]
MFGLGKSDLDKGLEAFAQRNWKRARKHLEDAGADGADAARDYHLGLLYWRGLGGERDARAAVQCFERAAKEGHVAAQTAFGAALRAGVGVRKDPGEAKKLFRAAAGGDDIEAMLNLADMGDAEEAKHWLERASHLGHAGAMRALGDILVDESPVQALSWLYASAAISANDATRKRAALLAREMSAEEIETAQRAGRALVRDLQRKRG